MPAPPLLIRELEHCTQTELQRQVWLLTNASAALNALAGLYRGNGVDLEHANTSGIGELSGATIIYLRLQ